MEYPLPAGFYAQEPAFLQRPGTSGEDEGVLLVQGLDANQNKGWSLSHTACVEHGGGMWFYVDSLVVVAYLKLSSVNCVFEGGSLQLKNIRKKISVYYILLFYKIFMLTFCLYYIIS